MYHFALIMAFDNLCFERNRKRNKRQVSANKTT